MYLILENTIQKGGNQGKRPHYLPLLATGPDDAPLARPAHPGVAETEDGKFVAVIIQKVLL